MKALVTGAHGQLGRALLASAPEGWNCVGVDRTALDITDPIAVQRKVEQSAADLIINAAAYTAVDRAEGDQEIALAVNGAAVGSLAAAADANGAHLVHVSSDFVFGGSSPRAYTPGDARNPLSVYGKSKALGEAAAGSRATVVRTSWVYAAGGNNFVRTMLRLMRERSEVRVVADQIGAPTWAVGLASVIWSLGRNQCPGVWHHSDAGVASWYDFAVAIAEEGLGVGLLTDPVKVIPISTSDYPTPAQRPAFSILDSSATLRALNAEPVHWRTNLRLMLKQEAELGSS